MKPLALFTALAFVACQSEAPEATDAASVASEQVAGYDAYGATFAPDDAVPVRAAVAEAERYVGQPVKLEGTVREVCQMAGCWLALDVGDGQTVRIMVERNDGGGYVYTVPTDVAGRQAVVHGTLEAKTITADEQRHYAEDAGEALPDDVQPRQELQMTATGILIQES